MATQTPRDAQTTTRMHELMSVDYVNLSHDALLSHCSDLRAHLEKTHRDCVRMHRLTQQLRKEVQMRKENDQEDHALAVKSSSSPVLLSKRSSTAIPVQRIRTDNSQDADASGGNDNPSISPRAGKLNPVPTGRILNAEKDASSFSSTIERANSDPNISTILLQRNRKSSKETQPQSQSAPSSPRAKPPVPNAGKPRLSNRFASDDVTFQDQTNNDNDNDDEQDSKRTSLDRKFGIDAGIAQSQRRRKSLAPLKHGGRATSNTLFKRSKTGIHFAEFALSRSRAEPARISLIVTNDFTDEPVQCLTIDQDDQLQCQGFCANALQRKLGSQVDMLQECNRHRDKFGYLDVGNTFCLPLPSVIGLPASFAIHFFAGNNGKEDSVIEYNVRRAVISCLESADALQLRSICFSPLDTLNSTTTSTTTSDENMESEQIQATYGTDPSKWIVAAHTVFSAIEDYYHSNRYTTNLLDIRIVCTTERDATTLRAMFTLEHNKYLKQQSGEQQSGESLAQKEQSRTSHLPRLSLSSTSSFNAEMEEDDNDEDPSLYYGCDIRELYFVHPEPDTPEYVEYMDTYESDDQTKSPRKSPRSGSTQEITKQIKHATLSKLVEYLTHFKASEDRHEFQFAFMLTYRSLTTSVELVQKLVDRYMLPPPNLEITPKEFAAWNREVLKPTRLRVVQILKYWMENQWRDDFEEDEALVQKIEEFCDLMDMTKGTAYSKQLRRTVERMKQDRSKNATQQIQETLPATIWPKNYNKTKANGGTFKLLDWNPKEIARQLTLVEFDMFRGIRTNEFLNQAWNAKNRESKAPNIFKMIHWFNVIACWVATEIVQTEPLKLRAKKASLMISIANECRHLNNYNAMFEILSGMELAAVHRLRQTWSALDKHSRIIHEELKQLTSPDHNFRSIRHQILFLEPPCLPYIGIFLTDLVFIEDGNPSTVNGKISFFKRRKLAQLIRNIMTYQNTPYKYAPVPEIQDHFHELEPLSENQLYTESLLREPRQPSA